MNVIEMKVLNGELKYKNTTVLTYNIEYPEIVSSNYNFGRTTFNRYNKNISLRLLNRINNQLYKEAVKLYEYNMANGYPIMVYEIILQYNITYNENSIISLYSDQYEFTRRCTRKYNKNIPNLGFTIW